MTNPIMRLLLAAGMFAASSAIAEARCTIYEHRDYGGASFTLGHLDRLLMVRGEDLGCQTSHGPPRCGYTYFRPAWNDEVSSFRVAAGCQITLWEHVNARGAQFRSTKSYRYVGSRWNDETSEVFCECRTASAAPPPAPAGTCRSGFVWREANASDRICVTPAERTEARLQNRNAANNRQPGGGHIGPNTCRSGYVWREAYPSDVVCVTPHERGVARQQNQLHAGRVN